ncbi:MAG: hypothetical protein IKX59_11280 [Bacteroidales bacterium]|nr:hypothetical protein [Bacteroidales bacterium]
MKRILLAAICCMAIGMGSVMAQDQSHGRGMRGQGRQQMFQLADTAITNHMNLTADQQVQIAQLNESFQEQMKAGGERGKRLDKETRQAQRTQIEAKRTEARKQLRAILGTELYIEYLEKALDRRPMMMGGMRPDGQNMPRSRGMRPDGVGNAFGGGGFGGGFGEGDF